MYDPMSEIHKRVKVDPVTGCWNWTKSCNSAGYGQFTKDKKYWLAHRYSYINSVEPVDANTVVRHLCHNTRCSNPKHLVKGTHKDNWYDSSENHKEGSKKIRKVWEIGGIFYQTIRDASKNTGIAQSSILKFTDPVTRVFDVESYREGCKIAGWEPKL